MSTKRIFGITIFGAAVVACVLIVMLVISYLRLESGELELPTSIPSETFETEPGSSDEVLERVEITRDTVQNVVASLSRPEQYVRDITIESFWDGGSATYNITAVISGGVTSLRILSGGVEKRIIVTDDKLYVWYHGDNKPYIPDSPSDELLMSDEWQMMLTYEDVLRLNKNDILDAGFLQYDGESCIYVDFTSPLLGYVTRCYISTTLGLITGAEEYDGETPVSRMTTGACIVDELDESAFTLPDGTKIL